MSSSAEVTTVKEGYLLKRGEYIKNWRPRWFVLRSDGHLLGLKDKPNSEEDYESPDMKLNDFSIDRIQIAQKTEVNGFFTFVIRCFQLTTLVERTLAADSLADREDWIAQIEKVSKRFQEEHSAKSRDFKVPAT